MGNGDSSLGGELDAQIGPSVQPRVQAFGDPPDGRRRECERAGAGVAGAPEGSVRLARPFPSGRRCGVARARAAAKGGTTAPAAGPPVVLDDLAVAERRIAELERKIGQQQLELDFFQQALRQVSGPRQPSDGLGAAQSTRSSKR